MGDYMRRFISAAILGALMLGPAGRAGALEISGKLDLTSLPSYGVWQSVTNTNEAIGVSKHLYSVLIGTQPLVAVGVFVGAYKPMLTQPAAPLGVLGGATVAVPGSLLDWAMNTTMGSQWLPLLKTGMLFSWDITRPNELHPAPSFIGVGASYAVGSGSQ